MKLSFICFSILFLTASYALAQESTAANAPEKKSWAHESEAAVVLVSGNNETETWSAKQKTSYTFDMNVLTLDARYLKGSTKGAETALNWDGTIRYDRVLSAQWGVYANHSLESDVYAGFIQRTSYGAGAKYKILATDNDKLDAEAGYRYTFGQFVDATRNGVSHYGRLYGEWNHNFNKGTSLKLWVEFLPNFTNSDAYLLNYEPSINVILSDVFGLKVAYLVKYQNQPAPPAIRQSDTTFTTALTAKL